MLEPATRPIESPSLVRMDFNDIDFSESAGTASDKTSTIGAMRLCAAGSESVIEDRERDLDLISRASNGTSNSKMILS